jgi:hypothetical protein
MQYLELGPGLGSIPPIKRSSAMTHPVTKRQHQRLKTDKKRIRKQQLKLKHLKNVLI